MSFLLTAASRSHPGKIREINEDAILTVVNSKGRGKALGLLIVADGIGGHKAGDIASQIAIDTIHQSIKSLILTEPYDDHPENSQLESSSITHREDDPINQLQQAIETANKKIFEYAQANPEQAGNLGTTITSALFWEDQVVIAHVGDSRAYRLRDKQLSLLTKDHSFVGRLIREGQLPPEAYYEHPRRNIITRALGQNPEVKIDLITERIQLQDIYFLCSDGLWELVRDPEIKVILLESSNLENTAQKLIEVALENGGSDNISVVIGAVNS